MFLQLDGAPDGVYWYTSAQIAAANADPGASGPGGIYNQIRASQSSSSSSSSSSTPQFSNPTPTSSTSSSSSGAVAPGAYQTINGPRTLQQMQQELQSVGYGGPTDSASILSTYGRTTGQSVQPIMNTTPGGTAPVNAAGQPITSGGLTTDDLSKFFAQTSGVTAAQLAQQKAEFDAQLQFARDQMTQLGIPQLQVNQYLAALQQQQFITQLAQVQAQETGFYQAPNLPALSMTGGANQPQATLGTGQGQMTLAAQAQAQQLAQAWAQLYGYAPQFGANGQPIAPGQNAQTLAAQAQAAQLSGLYNGVPTETAREFNANLGQQYLATAAQLQGPQNTFQLSNYLRGAQGNQAVPTYLQSLGNAVNMPAFQGAGSVAPTTQSAAGLAGQLGGSTSATPGWDYSQTLGAIQNIMSRGAQSLQPGALEGLTSDELQALGSGLGQLGGSLPAFLQAYQQSRIGQSAPTTTSLA